MSIKTPKQEVERAAAAWLAELRAQQQMPTDARQRVWQRIEGSLAQAQATPPAPSRTPLVVGLLAVAAMLIFVYYTFELGQLQTSQQSTVGNQAIYDHQRTATTQMAPALGGLVPERSNQPQEHMQVQFSREKPTATRQPKKSGETASPSEPEKLQSDKPHNSLAAEAKKLAQARTALTQKQPQQALRVLDEVARAFPNGALIEERAALRSIALCAGEQMIQGRGEARRFLANYPGSALTQRVATACGLAGSH